MRVPISWLADYVAIEMPIEDLAHLLTMSGLKVEHVESVGTDWQDVVVGEVLSVEPHPKSKKPLLLAAVELGGKRITAVTGAPNVRTGQKVPVVPLGGLLPHGPDGKPVTIEAKPMAGIVSEGMLASARELGISDEHEGIYVLPADVPVGEPLRNVMGEDVIEIETNPNRPDTLSIIGVAREVAAATNQQVQLPDLEAVPEEIQYLDEESIEVEVEAEDLCRRYSALRIEGIENGSSPAWMQVRLEAAGMRAISLLVDITNYVMLEYGQPLHAFDAHRLEGGRIVVRRAAKGERIRTLDGVDRRLGPENLVIADGRKPVAIAGVIGGEESEVAEDTADIILESANFAPINLRRTALTLGVRTESSSRFEKGLPPEQTILGLKRYLQLLVQIQGGGLRVAGISDRWAGRSETPVVSMPLRDLHRLLGVDIPVETAAEKLALLGFGVTQDQDALHVEVPFWRRADIRESADLVEEVARTVGYDVIPSTLPSRPLAPPPAPDSYRWEQKVREALLAVGASEVVTNSLTSPAAMAGLHPSKNGRGTNEGDWEKLIANPEGIVKRQALPAPVAVSNPATREREVLRLTLVPGLLAVIARNLKETEERLAFFEIGRSYFQRPDDLPYERRVLAIGLSGYRTPVSWQEPSPGPYSFYDLKGMLEVVLAALQITGWEVRPTDHPSLHPGRSALLAVNGQEVAFFGELHPAVAEDFDISTWPVQVAEIDLDTFFAFASDEHPCQPLPRYPAAYRDIAVIVDPEVPAAAVTAAVREAAGDVLEDLKIFDVYSGPSLPDNKKSLALRLTLRAKERTLGQDEIEGTMARIVETLSKQVGASLRE